MFCSIGTNSTTYFNNHIELIGLHVPQQNGNKHHGAISKGALTKFAIVVGHIDLIQAPAELNWRRCTNRKQKTRYIQQKQSSWWANCTTLAPLPCTTRTQRDGGTTYGKWSQTHACARDYSNHSHNIIHYMSPLVCVYVCMCVRNSVNRKRASMCGLSPCLGVKWISRWWKKRGGA